MEGYLGHIQSPEFKKDYPQDKIYLDVVLQEVPNQLILRLLYTSMFVEYGQNNFSIVSLVLSNDGRRCSP